MGGLWTWKWVGPVASQQLCLKHIKDTMTASRERDVAHAVRKTQRQWRAGDDGEWEREDILYVPVVRARLRGQQAESERKKRVPPPFRAQGGRPSFPEYSLKFERSLVLQDQIA